MVKAKKAGQKSHLKPKKALKVKKPKASPKKKVVLAKKKAAPAKTKNAILKAKKLREAATKRRAKLGAKTKATKKAAASPAAVKAAAKVSKQGDEREKKAEQLMVRGRETGFVTYDEILKVFPTIESDIEFLEELYDKFSNAKIDVLEGGGMLDANVEVP